MRFFFLLCAFVLFPFNLLASEIPLGHRFGVQIKEGRTTEKELKQIKAAGLHYVRFVIPWQAVERQKGRYSFSAFDGIMEKLEKHDLGAVIVLGGGNPYYTKWIKLPKGNIDRAEKTLAAPETEKQIQAFVSYAKETVKKYNRRDIIWEIWNEPDSDRFWPPKANSDAYTKLANATCKALRGDNKNLKIIGPSNASMPSLLKIFFPSFLSDVLESDTYSCFDGISIHPYRDGAIPPESVLDAYERLRKYIRHYIRPKEKVKPVFSTEWGFTLIQVSKKKQADYLLRSFLLNLIADIPVSIWYEWRDQWEGKDDPEAHFGLLTLDKKEKESYKALKNFLAPLKNARYLKRYPLGDEECFALSIKDPNKGTGLIFWSTYGKKDIILENDKILQAKERPDFIFFGKNKMKPIKCKARS